MLKDVLPAISWRTGAPLAVLRTTS